MQEIQDAVVDTGYPSSPPQAIPYVRSRLPVQRYTGGQSILQVGLYRLADTFARVVEVEGPIAKDAAKRRLAEAWQTRIGTRISHHLDNAIRLAERQKQLVIRRNFLWPVGMTTVPLRIPANGKDIRPIREIPPEETVLAIQECVTSAVGIEQDDLVREVCKLFGLKATDDNIYVVNYFINYLISNNSLISKNGKIALGNAAQTSN